MNIIIGHSNTDLDCLASMIAAQKLYPGYDIVISGLLNPLAGNVVSFYITKLSFKGPADLKDQQIDNVVVVDTRSSMRVKEFFANISRVNGSITIFDHHPPTAATYPEQSSTM